MHPVLYVTYHFLKLVVRAALWVFYSKTTVLNRQRGVFSNPCLVVSNHPSTLLDPFNTVVRVRRPVFFLANSSLFKHPVAGWLLSRLYCIPIERVQDTGGKPLQNAASFEKSSEFLSGGGCLYVAPEGSSFVERRLRKMKTGTARIAFAAESRNGFQLGLTILPVGLNYSDPTRFRSELLVIFGESIRVADFQKDWLEDEVEAVRKLTTHLAQRLSDLTIDTADDTEDRLLRGLEVIFQNKRRLSPSEHLIWAKHLQRQLQTFRAEKPEQFQAFADLVAGYFEKLKSLKISDLALSNSAGDLESPAESALRLAVVFPLAALGVASHFLPCFSAKKINGWFNRDLAFEPTFKFVAGIVSFPLFHGLQIWLLNRLALPWGGMWCCWLPLAYAFAVVPAGLAAEWFLKNGRRFLEKRRVAVLAKKDRALVEDLAAKRRAIASQARVFFSGEAAT